MLLLLLLAAGEQFAKPLIDNAFEWEMGVAVVLAVLALVAKETALRGACGQAS